MTIKMTNHVKFERTDRMTYIAMTVGFGEVIFEHQINGHRECITNSGVLLIKSLHEEVLITAYIVSIDKAIALYRQKFGNQRMPSRLYSVITNNAHHLKKQNQVVF